jgi:hypothetical protein
MYTYEQAIKALCRDFHISRMSWDSSRFLHKNQENSIIWQDGDNYVSTLSDIEATDWRIVYKDMNILEASAYLKEGRKVSRRAWEDYDFIYVKDRDICDSNTGTRWEGFYSLHFDDIIGTDWFLFGVSDVLDL